MRKEIPIVCFLSTYREGKLPQGTIRSVLKVTQDIICFEGLTEANHVPGPETDLGAYKRFMVRKANWESESAKRTDMLMYARRKFRDEEFWMLLLDGDEILVWGEYLRDWLNVLEPGFESQENFVPIKVTEAATRLIKLDVNGTEIEVPNGALTFVTSSHLYHSSVIDHYHVGAWQIVTPFEGRIAALDNRDSERPPSYGEPHIHHRPYLRRYERKEFRAHDHEESRWLDSQGLSKAKYEHEKGE